MPTPPSDYSVQLLELLNKIMAGQKSHTSLSRNTNEIAHRLKLLMALVETENQQGPGGETPQGLVQTLIDQIASMEEAQDRTAAMMLSEICHQTWMMEQIAQQLGVRVPPRSDSA